MSQRYASSQRASARPFPPTKRTRTTRNPGPRASGITTRRPFRAEVKHFNTHAFDYQTISSAQMSTNLTNVNNGIQQNQRVGAVIQAMSFTYRLSIMSSMNSAPACFVRVIFFRWNDDTAPYPPQIVNDTGVPESAYNYVHQAKWKILSDRIVDVPVYGTQKEGPPDYIQTSVSHQATLTTKWLCEYDREENDQDRGAIYCLIIPRALSSPVVTMTTTLTYVDI